MEYQQRRKQILQILLDSEQPITGEDFAKKFHVTRQIIVRDIALIRAEKYPIISTARGYTIQKDKIKSFRKTITVCHGRDGIEKELQIVVDLGGKVLNTSVNHAAYGLLEENLNIKSRKDIKNFLEKISSTDCEPLLALTNGIHMHEIEAENKETIEEICSELKTAGYLISC